MNETKKYGCPILEPHKDEAGSAWHEETHADMVAHLRDTNGWTDEQIKAWCDTHAEDHAADVAPEWIEGSRKYERGELVLEVSSDGSGQGMYIAHCLETRWKYKPGASMLDKLKGTENLVLLTGLTDTTQAQWVPAMQCFNIEGYAE